MLQLGDVIKMCASPRVNPSLPPRSTCGVQIDGYIALGGHTHVLGALAGCALGDSHITGTGPVPVEGRAADVVCAAHYAAEAVRRILRPGTKARARRCTAIAHPEPAELAADQHH